jgi:hypothetical protein
VTVIARLRDALDRPIPDADRQRAFAIAAALLLAAAVGLSLLATPPDPAQRAAGVEAISEPAVNQPRDRNAGGLPASVEMAARGFLAGYLARLYGHPDPPPLVPASPSVRRQLALPARVAPAMRARRPRVASLDGQRHGRGWLATAEVADGEAVSYPVAVVVADGRAGPVVVRVVED